MKDLWMGVRFALIMFAIWSMIQGEYLHVIALMTFVIAGDMPREKR